MIKCQRRWRSCRRRRISISKGSWTSLSKRTSLWRRRREQPKESSKNLFRIWVTYWTDLFFRVTSSLSTTTRDKCSSRLRRNSTSLRRAKLSSRRETVNWWDRQRRWRPSWDCGLSTSGHRRRNLATVSAISRHRHPCRSNNLYHQAWVATSVSTHTKSTAHLNRSWRKPEPRNKRRLLVEVEHHTQAHHHSVILPSSHPQLKLSACQWQSTIGPRAWKEITRIVPHSQSIWAPPLEATFWWEGI